MMKNKKVSRRKFIKNSTLGIAASALLPSILMTPDAIAKKTETTNEMFCYQCEQTLGGKGCTRKGVCGKTADVASLQDLLIYSLEGLSICAVAGRKVGVNDNDVNRFTCMALFSTLTNVDFDPYRFENLIEECVDLRERLKKEVKAAGGKIESTHESVTLKPESSLEKLVKQGKNYGLMSDPTVNPDIRSLQHMLLYGIKGMAALTDKSLGMDPLLALVLECGEKNLRAMELLDAGNTITYGHPVPTAVP